MLLLDGTGSGDIRHEQGEQEADHAQHHQGATCGSHGRKVSNLGGSGAWSATWAKTCTRWQALDAAVQFRLWLRGSHLTCLKYALPAPHVQRTQLRDSAALLPVRFFLTHPRWHAGHSSSHRFGKSRRSACGAMNANCSALADLSRSSVCPFLIPMWCPGDTGSISA